MMFRVLTTVSRRRRLLMLTAPALCWAAARSPPGRAGLAWRSSGSTRNRAGAMSVPYGDEEIAVFNTHEAGKFVPYSTVARLHGDRIYLGTNYGGGEGFYALRLPR